MESAWARDFSLKRTRASLIVPAKNEEEQIIAFLELLDENVMISVEVIIIVDTPDDRTLGPLTNLNRFKHKVRTIISSNAPGPAGAIKSGIDSADSDIVVVMMADGSDDSRNVDDLIRLVERGCVIAAASRYMPGGQQIGGPRMKKFLSKNSSRALRLFAGLNIHDATNSFKAYSVSFINEVEIESKHGFEVGLELTAKAHRKKKLIAEVPTIWIDRAYGESKFQLRRWLPHYLRWFVFGFGFNRAGRFLWKKS